MQRVRIGLTGLACVFLLVLLAAAFFGLTNDERETGRLVLAPADAPLANAAAEEEAPREPLAELGVAPGHAPDTMIENALVPEAPAPAPIVVREAPPARLPAH